MINFVHTGVGVKMFWFDYVLAVICVISIVGTIYNITELRRMLKKKAKISEQIDKLADIE